jgi:hypothetical protein
MSKRKKKKYADPNSAKLKQGSDNIDGSQEDWLDDSPSAGSADSGDQQPAKVSAESRTGEGEKPDAKPKSSKGKLQIFKQKAEEPGVETYKRPLWKHLLRYIIAFTIAVLNFSIVMSFITRLEHGQSMDVLKELFFFVFVGIVNVLFAVPAIFEVNRARVDDETLQLDALLWRTRLKWGDLVEFEQPRFLKFAILRTKRCFYLINRRDIIAFDTLARSITDKMASKRS